MVTGGLSWRRLGVLVAALPRESATARAQHGEAVEWSSADYLLAAIYDVLAAGNWQRGGGKGPRPKPIPRPGKQAEEGNRIGTAIPLDEMKKLAAKWMYGGLEGTTREIVEVV